MDPLQVLADQAAERAKTERAKDFWKGVARSVATVILSVSFFSQPVDVQANVSAKASDVLFIMRNCEIRQEGAHVPYRPLSSLVSKSR